VIDAKPFLLRHLFHVYFAEYLDHEVFEVVVKLDKFFGRDALDHGLHDLCHLLSVYQLMHLQVFLLVNKDNGEFFLSVEKLLCRVKQLLLEFHSSVHRVHHLSYALVLLYILIMFYTRKLCLPFLFLISGMFLLHSKLL